MRFKVTGGADGSIGINVGSRRYEPGDVVEMTQAKAAWLVERGVLVADSKSTVEPDLDDDDDVLDDEGDDL